MKKILVTGFEPFGDNTVNPSWLAVEAIGKIDGCDVRRLLLPVEWGRARDVLYNAIDEFRPELCLMVGLAASSDKIRIERVGINLCGAIRDNDGLYPDMQSEIPHECRITTDDCDAFFSTFDFYEIKRSLDALGIPSSYSYSAGTYLCNYVLFSALYKAKLDRSNMRAGFIHVPCCSEYAQNNDFSLPLGTIKCAVSAAVKYGLGDNLI